MTRPRQPCPQTPRCPSAEAPDRDAAVVVVDRVEPDRVLLSDGVVRMDEGELPDGTWTPDPVGAQAQHRDPSAV